MNDSLEKKVLITGGALRIGKQLAMASAKAGYSLIIHYNHSKIEAEVLCEQIRQLGAQAEAVQADFSNPEKTSAVFTHLFEKNRNIYALVNNVSVFKPLKFLETSLDDWQKHLTINLTLPFLLSQLFARNNTHQNSKIINLLDWRALRPGRDHFPYTISKAALAAMTQSLALALAPSIQVNGLALGAILPPSDGNQEDSLLQNVPAARWATLDELDETFTFLLSAPAYITGEIIHLDGGRHLV